MKNGNGYAYEDGLLNLLKYTGTRNSYSYGMHAHSAIVSRHGMGRYNINCMCGATDMQEQVYV